MPRPTKYPPEFRHDAVQLVLSSSPPRSVRVVARELGINHNTLQGWVDAERRKKAMATAGRRRADEDDELSIDEREELKRLRKQVAELQLEKEILRKAAAYFAKEMGR